MPTKKSMKNKVSKSKIKKSSSGKRADYKIPVKDILDPTINPQKRLINDLDYLKKIVQSLKEAGYKIVLTQGVWDLIHEGHAAYLAAAKKMGDILIVGVDSDELTRQRKGPRRPIVPEDERVRMISHLRHVDIITIRHTKQDIGDLVRAVRPDVFVVSKTTKDFSDKMKRDYAPICGKVVDLKHQAVTTTSARIRNLAIEGAQDLASEINELIEKFLNGFHK